MPQNNTRIAHALLSAQPFLCIPQEQLAHYQCPTIYSLITLYTTTQHAHYSRTQSFQGIPQNYTCITQAQLFVFILRYITKQHALLVPLSVRIHSVVRSQTASTLMYININKGPSSVEMTYTYIYQFKSTICSQTKRKRNIFRRKQKYQVHEWSSSFIRVVLYFSLHTSQYTSMYMYTHTHPCQPGSHQERHKVNAGNKQWACLTTRNKSDLLTVSSFFCQRRDEVKGDPGDTAFVCTVILS